MKKLVLILCILFVNGSLFASSDSYHIDVEESNVVAPGERQIKPAAYRLVQMNIIDLFKHLSDAPLKYNKKRSNVYLNIPLPNGSDMRFEVFKAPVMHPDLSLKYPMISTYWGISERGRNVVRFDVTEKGFHAMILGVGGTVYVDPYTNASTDYYISYYKSDFFKTSTKTFREEEPISYDDPDQDQKLIFVEPASSAKVGTATGEDLRTYRLALACTGEYANYHGGTKSSVMSAMTTSINRINGIYEREFSITLTLIPNNDTLIFLSSGSDPYSNNNGAIMLGQNQNTVDNYIGTANYDIGHVFSTGGGGIAGLGVVCNNSSKARGVTGLNNPIGDPFDVDYVAHEIGHQFDGNHTWNYCGGSGSTATAYEPGSATTIMGYAGLCGSANIQNNSDDYFHSANYSEISDYSQTSTGNSCPQITPTGNNAPIVSAGTGAFLPISTPFKLTASATDPNGNSLTYCWEQYDLGPSVPPNSPSGNCPIFRSFDPVSDDFRYFPGINRIVNNQYQTLSEKLPTYARSLNFRCTVRDNLGGVDYDGVFFQVDGSSGPFEVMHPNTNVTWAVNDTRTVTWDVANTNNSPVNCSSVNILLSTDGGFTYPVTLISNTPNDGSEAITVPNNQSTNCRIMVQAANNVFFDISNDDFTIDLSAGISDIAVEAVNMYPNPANSEVRFSVPDPSTAIEIEIFNELGQMVKSKRASGLSEIIVETESLDAGIYMVRLNLDGSTDMRKLVIAN